MELVTMTDQAQSEILEHNPIGKGLDAFCAAFNSICEDRTISCTPDALRQLAQEGKIVWRRFKYLLSNSYRDIQTLTIGLLSALLHLPAIRLLQSKTSHGTLQTDLVRLISAVTSDNFYFDRTTPLLTAALTDNQDDALIWYHVYNAVTESTPPPQSLPSSFPQIPLMRNTSSFANSSEHRKYVDAVLKEELGHIYVGLWNFHETFLGGVADLPTGIQGRFQEV